MTTKAAILKDIRVKCLDCCVYQPGEVRKCTVYTCGLWPYRFGKDPNPSRARGFAKTAAYATGSEEELAFQTKPPDPVGAGIRGEVEIHTTANQDGNQT